MTPDDHRNIAHMLLCIRDRTPDPDDARVLGDAADALRQCAEQQPVGWMKEGWGPDCGPYVEFYRDDEMGWRDRKEWKPLYAAPATTEAQREPLSDEQIEIPDYLRLQIACTAAAHDVLVERRRQIEVEGWTPEHDDEHDTGALALAAAAYALDAGDKSHPCSHGARGGEAPSFWPWHGGRPREARWWKPSDPRRNLVKAGALILAEIERLDRMGGSDER